MWAPEPRAEEGRSRGPGSGVGGSQAQGGFRRGCVLRTGRKEEGAVLEARKSCGSAGEPLRAACVLRRARGSPCRGSASRTVGFTSPSGEGWPILTLVCSAAVLRALHTRHFREGLLVSFPYIMTPDLFKKKKKKTLREQWRR